jgi:hypothetical protein
MHSSWTSLASSGVSPSCVVANSGCTNGGGADHAPMSSCTASLVVDGSGCAYAYSYRHSRCCSHRMGASSSGVRLSSAAEELGCMWSGVM